MFDERNREEVEYGTLSSFLNSRDRVAAIRCPSNQGENAGLFFGGGSGW
jgi:hypothetical protein